MFTITDVFYNTENPKCIEYEVFYDNHFHYILIIESKGQLTASVSTCPFIPMLAKLAEPLQYLETVFTDSTELYEITNNEYTSLEDFTPFDGLIGLGVETLKKEFDSDFLQKILEFKGCILIFQ